MDFGFYDMPKKIETPAPVIVTEEVIQQQQSQQPKSTFTKVIDFFKNLINLT